MLSNRGCLATAATAAAAAASDAAAEAAAAATASAAAALKYTLRRDADICRLAQCQRRNSYAAAYLCHGASSQEVCSHFHSVQVDLFEHHTLLLLLCAELFDLLDVNIIAGDHSFKHLSKVATA